MRLGSKKNNIHFDLINEESQFLINSKIDFFFYLKEF